MADSVMTVELRVKTESLNPLPPGWRYRSNWLGQLILQRSGEYHHAADCSGLGHSETVWCDASVSDLMDLMSVQTVRGHAHGQ